MIILVALILAASTFVFYANYRRRHFRFQDELEKNCLLTKHPILFLSGRRTIFYFLNYWNWIPYCLSDHGYEVYVLNLPWRNKMERIEHLKEFLRLAESRSLRFHVLADLSSQREVDWIAEEAPLTIASLTQVHSDNNFARKPRAVKSTDLRPRRLAIEQIHLHIPSSRSVKGWLWRTLIVLHNLVVLPERGLNPALTGVPDLADASRIKKEYLKIAISLAERDLKMIPLR